MSPDRLRDRLREIPTPQSARAREQAVAEARAEIAARGEGATRGGSAAPSREWRRRAPSLAAAALVVLVVLLTPPGRAASAWVGELVGIGEVGGPPSVEKRGDFAKHETAVVIDNGVAPDGTRYEWVAFECSVDLREEGLATNYEGIGVSLDWPGADGHEGGGSCEGLVDRPKPGAFNQHGVHVLPSQMEGVEEPDLVVSGTTGQDVHRISVIYTDGEGEKHELPVDFARVEGKLREVARRPEALGTFVAFVPGEWAARDELAVRFDLRALAGTGKLDLGPIARRERELAAQAFERCEPLQPGPSDLRDPQDQEAVTRALRSLRDCHERHMPPSPLEYVAYDEDGRELGRMGEPLIAAALRPPRTVEAEGREEPGDERWSRPGRGKVVVLLTGRSPDGALYEVFADKQGDYGTCLTTWWPFALGGGAGACGPELPPSTAFGRRDPEEVFAKPYGFLGDAPQATVHRSLEGFARGEVSRLEVAYRDESGGWHDVPVKLARVSGPRLEEVGATEPFGYWVGFVPRSAGRRPEIEVVSHGEDGRELGRHRAPIPGP